MTLTDVVALADHCGNLERLSIIREATKEQLLDPDWLEDAILRVGCYPATGIPEKLWDTHGLGVCQFPSQLAPYLIRLAALGVRRYAEIGVWVGGCFAMTVEYLSRFGLKKALAVDVLLQGSVRRYADENRGVRLIEAASTSREARTTLRTFKPDLILVDGDHTEEGCRSDWRLAKRTARWVALHDIVGYPAVQGLWDSIDLPKEEWVAQYDNFPAQAGLGLVRCAT